MHGRDPKTLSQKKVVLKRILIIDALNIYLRAYISNPSIALNGEPIGGAFGFLKSLQKYCREMKPDHIIVCWDGPDGSRKRKTMHKGYKDGRKPIRLNRNVRIMSEEEEFRNRPDKGGVRNALKKWQEKSQYGLSYGKKKSDSGANGYEKAMKFNLKIN